jgi:hypothetical protein
MIRCSGVIANRGSYSTHALCSFAEQRLHGAAQAAIVAEEDLRYPRHPFSPELCTTCANLPLGLSDIALEGQLSEQVIESLHQLSTIARDNPWTKNATISHIYKTSVEFMTFFTRDVISYLERSICLFCFIFMVRELPERNESQKIYGTFLTTSRKRAKKVSEMLLDLQGVNADFATWGVAMFAIDNSSERFGLDESERSEMFHQLFEKHPSTLNWKTTAKYLRRFFFLDKWEDAFRARWAREVDIYRKRPREVQ